MSELETVAMGGANAERTAQRKERAKEKHYSKLRRLIDLDWSDDYEIDYLEVSSKLEDFVKFFNDSGVKAKVGAKAFKTIHNSLVEAALALEKVNGETELLKKV